MKRLLIWFKSVPSIIQVSLVFYLFFLILYFFLLGWQREYLKGCPIYEPFEANFLSPECENNYQRVFQLESLLLQGGIGGYLSLLLWSLIGGIRQFKKKKKSAFLPLLLNLGIGLVFLFTAPIWLFNLIF